MVLRKFIADNDQKSLLHRNTKNWGALMKGEMIKELQSQFAGLAQTILDETIGF